MKSHPQNCQSEFPAQGSLGSPAHLDTLVSVHRILPKLVILLMKLLLVSHNQVM